MSLGAYFQCYKNPYATYMALTSFRAHYPTNTIVLLSDNGYNYNAMAAHFNCKYIHSTKNIPFICPVTEGSMKHAEWVHQMIERLTEVFSIIREDYVMWLEDDVVINGTCKGPLTYDINGYNPNQYSAKTKETLHRIYNWIDPSMHYTWSGHGGSIFNKTAMLTYFKNTTTLDDIANHWFDYDLCKINFGCDYFLSIMTHLNKGTVGPLYGAADGPRDRPIPSILFQHQYKRFYGVPLPAELRYLVASPVTCVTAIYDIGRGAVDGRTMDQYKSYLIQTLQSFSDPLVLFLDPTLGWKEELIRCRTGGPLQIMEVPFCETMMWPYKEQIDTILVSKKHKNPKDITNCIAGYCMIQYNKFDFLERVINANPFQSSHFCWIDAGISRFIDCSKQYSARGVPSEKFSVQSTYSRVPVVTPDDYIGTNTCILKGGVWYTSPSAFAAVKAEVMHIWKEEMMAKGRIDNEQIALALAYQQIPEQFKVFVSPQQFDTLLSEYFTSNEKAHKDSQDFL